MIVGNYRSNFGGGIDLSFRCSNCSQTKKIFACGTGGCSAAAKTLIESKPCNNRTTCNLCSGTGNEKCSACDGKGYTTKSGPCLAHSISGRHYYCTSSLNHGNNVAQYH